MVVDPWAGSKSFQHGKTDDLKRVFFKYASVEHDGEWYMTSQDFIRKFLGVLNTPDYHPGSVKLLAGIIDTSKDGLISFVEFQAFERVLCIPDALYNTAFRLFDTKGNGIVSFDEFKEIIVQTTLQKKIPFNLDGNFVKLYFGRNKDRVVTYSEFSQFLHDFHEEYGAEAFRRFDEDETGFISADDFYTIMTTIRSHLLTKEVTKRLKQVVKEVTGGDQVSFPFFVAFNRFLNNIELVKRVYLQATHGVRDKEITKNNFLFAAQMMSHITPLEIDILFRLSDLMHKSPTIIYSDLQNVAPEQYYKRVNKRVVDVKAVQDPAERGVYIEFLENVYRFIIGSAAGAVGAIAVYPMDLVKTRMQIQRPSSEYDGRLYRNNRDCFKKALRSEGFRGLYRGLMPQVYGVAIGKALKLTVNDYCRDKFMNRKRQIPLWGEIVAGACAGASYVVFANPLEVIKIRIQIAGERAPNRKLSAFTVIRQLGFFGLYRGMGACFLRDVPFGAIFFPAYAHTKVKLQDEDGYNSGLSLILAGAIASVPGSPLSMPCDVIKTRLQAEARPGQTQYKGILDAARKIYGEEGLRAFWQGTRLIKPSSQFGVTLFVYEILQRIFYIDFAGTRPTGSEATVLITGLEQVKSENPDHVGGYSLALPILAGIESKFGLVLPQFKHTVTVIVPSKKVENVL